MYQYNVAINGFVHMYPDDVYNEVNTILSEDDKCTHT